MNIFKKALIVALSIGLISVPTVTKEVEAATTSTDTILYLTPNSNWTQSNARFAAYFFGNGEKWVSMTDSDKDSVYEVSVPSGYSKVIFCRMNPSATANNWNNKWNQTADLIIPNDGTNHYTVKEGTWDKGGGTWSNFNTGEISEAKVNTKWYLKGTFNTWESEDLMSPVEGSENTYSISKELEAGDEFKVSDEGWTVTFEYSNISSGNNYVTTGSENGNIKTIKSGTYNLTISFEFDKVTGVYSSKNLDINFTGEKEFSYSTKDLLYLTPNSNWVQSDAWFAAYFYGNGEQWMSLKDEDNNGVYEVETPVGFTSVIFCRMNPENTALSWDSKWDQTVDLSIPEDGKNHFTINDDAWNNAEGVWSLNAHLKGYIQENSTTTGVRIVSTFGNNGHDKYTADNYDEVGFVVTVGDQSKTAAVKYVYSSLIANETEVKASSYGAVYFFVLTINEIPKGTTFTFKPYAKTGDVVEYGSTTTVYYYC